MRCMHVALLKFHVFCVQVAKIFASAPGAAGGSAGGGADGQKRKGSMATNTLATKFKGSLTTLM